MSQCEMDKIKAERNVDVTAAVAAADNNNKNVYTLYT